MPTTRMSSERGDIVLRWLLKVVGGLLLAAIVLLDGGALVVNRMQLSDAALQAATAARFSWQEQRSEAAARAAAIEQAGELSGVAVEVSLSGGQVSVTLQRRARVRLADRVAVLAALVDPVVTERVSLSAERAAVADPK